MDEELVELQDPGSWDLDDPQVRPPVKQPRAVVSVAFSRADYEQVVRRARAAGKTTSEYIREAALERASRREGGLRVLVSAESDLPSVIRTASGSNR